MTNALRVFAQIIDSSCLENFCFAHFLGEQIQAQLELMENISDCQF